jgi:hypothetical protein
MLDLAKDVALLAGDMAAHGGIPGPIAASGIGSSAVLYTAARWLSSPASAASMAAWSRAYRAAALSPTPVRIAAFNLATRNLSHTLGVPAENITRSVVGHLGRTEDTKSDVENNARH